MTRRHAANLRSASRSRYATPIWDYSGEIGPLHSAYRDTFGARHNSNSPDNDRDENRAARNNSAYTDDREWDER